MSRKQAKRQRFYARRGGRRFARWQWIEPMPHLDPLTGQPWAIPFYRREMKQAEFAALFPAEYARQAMARHMTEIEKRMRNLIVYGTTHPEAFRTVV